MGKNEIRYFGRKILYADYKEEELNEKVISEILNDVFKLHLQNASQIDCLENYYKGYQPIINKEKDVRPNINNKIVENNAYYLVEFKKSFVFGKPIQYVQRGDTASKELGVLNSFMLAEGKYTKDTELAESLYTSGIAHRIVLPDVNEDSPFEIRNLDSKRAFVVYSSYNNKPLLGCYYTVKIKSKEIDGVIYTKDSCYEFKSDNSGMTNNFNIRFISYHILNDIPIIEYRLNKSRIGIIEVVLDILNALNKITSDEIDGLEQYVQSLLVFINQDVDEEDIQDFIKQGAVKLLSQTNLPADVKMISNEINHANTKVLHDRLFNTMLNIVGIPKNSDKASGGDTGQARYLGEGWTMADARADGDEAMFKECAKPELKMILRICALCPNSGIKELTIKDIDIKLPRNKSDNFLVKSQGMMNQINAGISPDVAITTSGLYSDPNETFDKSMNFYGGIDNWIKLFVGEKQKEIEQVKELQENNEEKEEPYLI